MFVFLSVICIAAYSRENQWRVLCIVLRLLAVCVRGGCHWLISRDTGVGAGCLLTALLVPLAANSQDSWIET